MRSIIPGSRAWGMHRNQIGHLSSSTGARQVSNIELSRRVPLLLSFVTWIGLTMAMVLPHPAAAGESSASTEDKPNAIAVFGGLMTYSKWEETLLPWDTDYGDSTLVGLAASHDIGRFDHRLSFEIEGQVVRHFGDQDHWEFNLPIVGRWKAFSWDEVVDTSLAFGIGPSYASEIPEVEVINGGDSQRWLVYWMAEIEVGPPDRGWSTIFRIHHRSGAFGVVADEGGSNALVIGFRQRF